jgi:fructokinase
VASVGNDSFGNLLLQNLQKEGLNIEHIFQYDQYATSLIVVGKTKGTPDFIAYRNADYMIEKVDETLISNASLVHTTAFALSKQPAQSSILKAVGNASKQGIPVSVDWNYSEKVWGQYNNALTVFNQLQSYKPIFKFSLDDVERFMGKSLSIEEAKAYLNNVLCTAICLTCGGDGVYYKSSMSHWQFMPAQPIEVKDATGAGDAFWAGFVSEWDRDSTLELCVSKGINTASLKLQGIL